MFQSAHRTVIEDKVLDAINQEEIRTIIESPDGGKYALELVKRFEFDHNRKCMSVIVSDLQETHQQLPRDDVENKFRVARASPVPERPESRLDASAGADVQKLLLSDDNDQTASLALELAMTKAVFNYLNEMSELRQLIIARMTPVEKVDCVAEMMATGVVTGMCGNGGNDRGTLCIAHVGVALSDTEESVVSPFTSQTKSIAAVVDLCREGRCTLATTSGNPKFLVLYGRFGVGLRSRGALYCNSVFVSRYSFVVHDGRLLVGLVHAITLAKPTTTLNHGAIHVVFLSASVRAFMTDSCYCPFNLGNVNVSKGWLIEGNWLVGCWCIQLR